MQAAESPSAQRLLEAFVQLRRLNWKHKPVAGLTLGEVMVLSIVRSQTAPDLVGVKVSEISNLLKIASPTVTQQINTLESLGLVERSMDKEDRRAIRVTLTDVGCSTVQRAHEQFLASFNGLAEYLGEEDSARLADLLSRAFTYFSELRQADI